MKTNFGGVVVVLQGAVVVCYGWEGFLIALKIVFLLTGVYAGIIFFCIFRPGGPAKFTNQGRRRHIDLLYVIVSKSGQVDSPKRRRLSVEVRIDELESDLLSPKIQFHGTR